MKRIIMTILVAAVVCVGVFAQSEKPTIYVSANGEDTYTNNENTPFLTIQHALMILMIARAQGMDINSITVIGTLDERNSGNGQKEGYIFSLINPSEEQEIVITGKPGATGAQRAVLSGKGTGRDVLSVFGRFRLENIEISGGKIGIVALPNSRLTLGAGAVVQGNSSLGIGIMSNLGEKSFSSGMCVIDGGEVRNNAGTGISINKGGILTMRNGIIRDNKSSADAGGIDVAGTFSMNGGTITGNSAANSGGGVYVRTDGTFNQTGGTINNNTAKQSPNIYRATGTKGSNL